MMVAKGHELNANVISYIKSNDQMLKQIPNYQCRIKFTSDPTLSQDDTQFTDSTGL